MTKRVSRTSQTVRLNLFLSRSLHAEMKAIAESAGVSMADVLRCGLALLKVAREARRSGMHFGICEDATNLDREIIGLI